VNCHGTLAQLNAFLDNEVAAKDSLAVEQHLRECPACAAQFARERAWREGLRAKADYHAAPESLRRRVRAIAAPAPASTRVARPPRTVALSWPQLGGALAAVAVLAWTSAVVVLRPPAEQLAADDMVAAHVQATLAHRLTDVDSSDRHTVKPWLSNRLDYSPPVRDFAADGFPLAGGRIARLFGHDLAALVYRYGDHVIDVFVVPESTPLPATLRTVRGFNVAQASGGGMRWSAVADVNAEALQALVAKLAAPAPP
jgi:anti-sigma factor (TIGR02949 family)